MGGLIYLGMRGDIVHPGIINIINEGAKRGELLVGLLTDSAIANHKRLPHLNYEQRKNVIENIKAFPAWCRRKTGVMYQTSAATNRTR